MGLFEAWLHPAQALAAAGGPPQLPDPVAAAVPLFFALILVELFASWKLHRPVYDLRQTISNVAAGILATLLGIFLKALHVFPYAWLRARVGLLPSALAATRTAAAGDGAAGQAGQEGSWASTGWEWWAWNLLALLVADCGFYWQHRAMHAANILWSAHVVHHSSPDFNLSTALRQGAGESTFSWLFYLPLALFCPTEVYALHRGLNTVYQFFTHTELVGRLWWPVELVMNTPSHHRVHHARNYGRRNFAGMLIIWDRLFGTFEAEQPQKACIYGLDAQRVVQGTWQPLWHQAHHAAATLRLTSSGKVPAWRAFLTRAYGPGMVRPTVTDAEPAGHAANGGAAAADGPAADGTAAAQPAAERSDSSKLVGSRRVAGKPWFPWEQRPLKALDYYAGLTFFLWTLPWSFAYMLAVGEGRLSPLWVFAGAAFSAWSTVSAGWLCSGEVAAMNNELARLLVQMPAPVAVGLVQGNGRLPGGCLAACAFIILSILSVLFVTGQLTLARPHQPRTGQKAPRPYGWPARQRSA